MDFRALYLRCRYWLIDFLQGSPVRKPYNEIKFLSEHSLEEGKGLREKKLKDILFHASSNTVFYKGYSDDLRDYPVMNKSLYIKHYDEIKVALENIPAQKGKVHIQTTSGSTGTPFAVPQDTNKRNRRVAELKYFGKVVGFKTHEKLIHLRTWNRWQSKTSRQIQLENIIPFDISEMGNLKMAQLCKTIHDENAICLRGYASSFDLLANYVQFHPQDFPSLKVIIAGSEALHEDTRAKVKKNLKCEIISQYANEECGILAQERVPTTENDNPMYLNHSSYFFEVLKMDSDAPAEYGELGRIVVTDLHNYAFPIIRYDSGDVGILLPADKYSNGYPVLGKIYGRRFDVCYTTNNQPFTPMTIGRILKHFDCILQWQFIQKDAKLYLLKLILKSSINNTDEYISSIVVLLKDALGDDAEIQIELVDGIPVLSSGKRKPVINEWKK